MGSATGSRTYDLVIFFALSGALLLYSPKMRVYYQGRPCEVTLTAIGPDGVRTELTAPVEIQGAQNSITRTQKRILRFVRTEEGKALGNTEGRLEWHLTYKVSGQPDPAVRTIVTHKTDG